MKLKRFLLLFLIAALISVLIPLPVASFSIDIKTDRPEAIYRCGEPTEFLITFRGSELSMKEVEAMAILTLDGLKEVKKEKINISDKTATVTSTLNEPGFLRCNVSCVIREIKYESVAAAGFEPENIKAMTKMPDDFDQFWAEGQAELAKIPLDVRLTPLPEYSSEAQKAYKISFANIDNTRIYGYLNVPTKETEMIPEPKIPGSPLVLRKKLYPAYVSVPGAGVGPPREPIVANNILTLHVSVHDHDLGLPLEVYEKLNNGRLKGHYYLGAPDRKRYYFRRAILGVDRAIDYLTSRPEFNGKQIVIYGISQGGFFSLMMAGLNKNISAAVAIVPGFGDQAAYLAGRMPGSPQLVLAAPKKDQDQWLEMSKYYDTVNFSRKIKCPVIVYTGFIDQLCPPGSVYAAYNDIKSPKRIFNGALGGHNGTTTHFSLFIEKWIGGQLGLTDPIQPFNKN